MVRGGGDGAYERCPIMRTVGGGGGIKAAVHSSKEFQWGGTKEFRGLAYFGIFAFFFRYCTVLYYNS